MTALLRPSTYTADRTERGPGRPLALSAVLAGIWAPSVLLAATWGVGLAGWFASDGGAHGEPRDVLRVGADAWLLAHGAGLTTAHAQVTAAPLGLTLLAAWLTFRAGRAAAIASRSAGPGAPGSGPEASDLGSVGLATIVLAGTYGIIALLTAVLASVPSAAPSWGWAFVGGIVLGGVAGGSGLLAGSGQASRLWWSQGAHMRSALLGAAGTVLLMLTLAAVAVAGALAINASAAANVLTELQPDLAGGVLSVLLLAAVTPNAVLLACAYLLGPGFAVGVGTVVSPAEVALGPVPAVPLLAALPADGAGSGWSAALLAVPALVAASAAALAARAVPTRSFGHAVGRAVAGAVLAALTLTLLVRLAGGSIGPARMSHLGAPVLEVLLVATGAFATGAVLGALVATWWHRRRIGEEDAAAAVAAEAPTTRIDLSTEPTVRLPRPPRSLP